MFPYSNNGPASPPQPLVCVAVTFAVASDLLRPVPGIDLMIPHSVPRTTVPETTIDEDCDLRRSEDNVNPSASARNDLAIEPVSKPDRVQFAP